MKVYFITPSKLTSNNGGAYVQVEDIETIEDAKQMGAARNYDHFIIDDGKCISIFDYKINENDCWEEIENTDVDRYCIWDYVDRRTLTGSINENIDTIKRIAISYEEMLEKEPEFMFTGNLEV